MLGWIRAADYHLEVACRAYDQAAREALRSGGALAFEYELPEVSGAELTVADLTDGCGPPPGSPHRTAVSWAGNRSPPPAGRPTLAVPTFLRDLALNLTR